MVNVLLLVVLLARLLGCWTVNKIPEGQTNEVEKGGWETAVCVSFSMISCTAAITLFKTTIVVERHAADFSMSPLLNACM